MFPTYFTKLVEATDSEQPQWLITYQLVTSEYDDELDSTDQIKVILNAIDAEQAVRYAQQYLRKQKLENSEWESAEILSVERY